MNRDASLARKWRNLSLVFFLACGLTGCIAPVVKAPSGAQLDIYRKVYVVEPKEDPRGVGPRVSARLKRIGFQVVELQQGSTPTEMQGTGFVITPAGHVLTCAHLVGSLTNATTWIGGQRYPCTVLSADTNLDLAVLLVTGTHPPFVPLMIDSTNHYSLGQDAFSMGFPLAELLGKSPRLNKGMISATVGLDDDPKYVQFSAPVQPGNSGGPLLNEKCEVIGVIASTLNPMRVLAQSGGALPQNVNFAIKTDSIHDFLAAANIALPANGDEATVKSFDDAQKSLGLVRSGNVTEEDLKQRGVVCAYTYISLRGLRFRFRAVEVRFYDLKKGQLILKVGQYEDDPFSTEDGELDRICGEISDKFFPQNPNPFKHNQ
jgi:S1-C subfamily serine protease